MPISVNLTSNLTGNRYPEALPRLENGGIASGSALPGWSLVTSRLRYFLYTAEADIVCIDAVETAVLSENIQNNEHLRFKASCKIVLYSFSLTLYAPNLSKWGLFI